MRRTRLGSRVLVITSNLKFTCSHVVREHRTTRIPLLLLALLSFHLKRLMLYVFLLFLCDCVPCLYGLSALTPCSHQGSEMLNERLMSEFIMGKNSCLSYWVIFGRCVLKQRVKMIYLTTKRLCVFPQTCRSSVKGTCELYKRVALQFR